MTQRIRFKRLYAEEVHTIGSTCACHNNQPRHMTRRLYFRAFTRYEVVRFVGSLEAHVVVINVGILLEHAADLAQPRFPRRALNLQLRRRGKHLGLRFLRREVRGNIFFLRAHLLLGLHLQQRIECPAISAVGRIPKRPRNRLAIVVQRQRQSRQRAGAMVAVGVVERRRTEPDLHIRNALPAAGRVHDRTVLRGNTHVLIVRNRVAQKVRLRLRLCRLPGLRVDARRSAAEVGHRACHLRIHGLEQNAIRFYVSRGLNFSRGRYLLRVGSTRLYRTHRCTKDRARNGRPPAPTHLLRHVYLNPSPRRTTRSVARFPPASSVSNPCNLSRCPCQPLRPAANWSTPRRFPAHALSRPCPSALPASAAFTDHRRPRIRNSHRARRQRRRRPGNGRRPAAWQSTRLLAASRPACQSPAPFGDPR